MDCRRQAVAELAAVATVPLSAGCVAGPLGGAAHGTRRPSRAPHRSSPFVGDLATLWEGLPTSPSLFPREGEEPSKAHPRHRRCTSARARRDRSRRGRSGHGRQHARSCWRRCWDASGQDGRPYFRGEGCKNHCLLSYDILQHMLRSSAWEAGGPPNPEAEA